MKQKNETLKAIKEFFTEDDYIAIRFQLMNMVLLGGEMMVFASKKTLFKTIGILAMPVSAYLMNQEMSKFMQHMLDRR